jgi:alpha-N-acetylglucosaminidase
MSGVGIMPEGIANNPVAYDLALELAWRPEHVDAARWIEGYIAYRYGQADADLGAAWALLLRSAYSSRFEGGPENVLLARPRTPAGPVTPWGSLEYGYDPAILADALGHFARASARFGGSETYRLDLLALRIQVLAGEAHAASARVDAALAARDRPGLESAAAAFLRLGSETNTLLEAEPSCRLSTYRAGALRYGTTPAEKASCLRNAMMLVTYWGGDDERSNADNDYAHKAWAGMMDAYYLRRWKIFFDYQRRLLAGETAAAPDFYAWGRTWVEDACRPGALDLP